MSTNGPKKSDSEKTSWFDSVRKYLPGFSSLDQKQVKTFASFLAAGNEFHPQVFEDLAACQEKKHPKL